MNLTELIERTLDSRRRIPGGQFGSEAPIRPMHGLGLGRGFMAHNA